jgi:hypothetical protein
VLPSQTNTLSSGLSLAYHLFCAAKVVQIERKAKEKSIFLFFSEMQPIFERSSKVQIIERKAKEKFPFICLIQKYTVSLHPKQGD